MTGRVERLDWDTEFFGVPIGRADIDGATPEVLAEIDEEARDMGLVCLYGSIDSRKVAALATIARSPWVLVEVGIMLVRDTSLSYPRPTGCGTARVGTPRDVDALGEYFERLAPWSRYAMDPRFGLGEAKRLMRAWFERAADPDSERYGLHVVEDDAGSITSIMTLVYGDDPQIDLVATTVPGADSSDAVMAFTLDGVQDRERIWGGVIAARNISGLTYTLNSKFRLSWTSYSYHRWLDEDGGSTK